MSLEDMINEEPVSTLLREPEPRNLSVEGIPLDQLQVVRTVSGRYARPNAKQARMWETLGVEVDYAFITFDSGIENGNFLQGADGRLFRVQGTGGKNYGKGGIADFYSYPVVEARKR